MNSIKYVVGLLLIVMACSQKAETQDEPSQTTGVNTLVTLTSQQIKNAEIVVGSPRVQSMSNTIRLNGIVDVPPVNKVSITNPFGGYIKKINLLPGTRVKRGDILAVMEDPQYIQLQQDYLVTKSKLEFLEKDFKRQQDLNKDKSISDKAFQQVNSDYLSQKVTMKALSEKLKMLHINPETLDENSLSRAINIYSPMQGYVSSINANVGAYLNPTDVLLELVDERKLHVMLTVFEKDLPLIRTGQKLYIQSNLDAVRKHEAIVHAINKSVGDDRSSEIHCDFTGETEGLLPGMFVNAELQLQSNDVLVVPDDAVVRWEDTHYIFIEKSNDTFSMIPVEIGLSSQGYTEVKNIDKEQRLVVKNAYSVLMKMKTVEE